MVFENFSYYSIGPLSVIAWLGLITYSIVAIAAYTGYKGMDVKLHKKLAITAVILATIHGGLVILSNF